MNRIYRTLWSAATQSWQAVPETAKSAGKKSKSSAGGIVASVALGFSLNGVAHAQSPPALPPAINQLPTGGTVVRGTATIQQTATAQAAAMMVNQSSQRAVVNWNTFNLGSAASINFVQPNAQAVTLNRVNDSNPSQIFGRITANGQVFLTNASGVYFSPSSSVDVGAITATTHSITDDNFMSGNYVFDRNGSTGKVVNEGHITAALGGYVALLAPEVQNAGVVVARAGTVAMAAGELITLNIDGAGSLAGITTTPSAIASLVENKLAVLAPDGKIILSAAALDKLQAGVVRNSGSLEANSLINKGGKIVLEGDEIVMDRNSKIEAKGRTGGGVVLVGGDWQGSGDMRQATKVTMEAGATIDASATDNGDGGKVVLWSDIHNADSVTRVNGSIKAEAGPNGGDGGQIETSGHVLNVDGIQVSTQSQNSTTGEWLLDPWDITIASSGATGTTWAAGTAGTTTKTYTSAAASTILDTSITGALATSNVVVKTGGTAGDGNGNGDINVTADLSWSTAKMLTFTALGGISGTGNISMTGGAGAGLTFDQTGNSTYSGIISGTSATLTKLGTGTLTLTSNNTYGGITTLSAGTLQIGNGGTAGSLGTGAVTNTAALKFNRSDLITISNLISSTGTVEQAGSGTLTLSGSNTYSGGTTISAGTLKAGSATAFGTNAIIVNSGAVLDLNGKTMTSTGGLTLNGTGIAGGGALINSSATAATYAGLVTLNSDITITGGTGKITLSNTGTINGGNYVLTLDGAAVGSTIASIIGTSISTLTKQGAGTWILTGANTYSGTTTISAGTLQFGNGTVTTTTMGTGLIINNGTLGFSTAVNQTFAPNTISGTGALTAFGGAGTITLRADNTFSGGITLSSGPTLMIGGSSVGTPGALTSGPFGTGTLSMGPNSQVDLAGYQIGNTLKSTGTANSPAVIYANSGGVSELSGLIDVTTASAYFKLSPSAGNTIKLTGTLNNLATIPTTGAQTVFGQSGAGDVLASFSAIPNKYNFELLATAGKWTIGNSLSGTKAGFILNGGTLDTAGFDMGTAGDSEDARFNGGTFTNSGTTTSTVRGAGVYFTQSTTISTPNATGHLDLSKVGYTYGSTIAGITITKTGPGDLHFRSSFTDAGATPSFYPKDYIVNVSAGNLWYDNYSNAGGFAGTYSIATGSTMYLNIPTTKNVTGNITGGGSVVLKTSATLSGANTYTGGTTVLNGATLTFGSAAVMSGNTITSGPIGTGALTLGDANSSGVVNLNSYALLPNNVIINGTSQIQSGTLNSAQVISGTISDGINAGKGLTFSFSSVSPGKTMEIVGNNTYTGASTINGNATSSLIVSNSNALGIGSAGITLGTYTALMLKGGITLSKPITMTNNDTLGSLSGDNTIAAAVAMSGITGFSGAGNLAINGAVTGATGTMTKSGAGMLTLAGDNNFTGIMTVSAGVLRAASNTALGSIASNIRVSSGATLELGGPSSPSGIAIGAKGLIVDSGGLVHNVAGYNTYAGAMSFGGSATITVDTGTRLNFTATAPDITYNTPNLLTFNTNGNLSIAQPLKGTGSYVKVGSGTLTLASTSTITGKIGIYAGLYDPSGTDYSSEYGSNSAPDLTFAFFDSTSGGNRIAMTSGTDYSGAVTWTGTVPTSSSNAGTYALTYASGLTVTKTGYVLLGATTAKNWVVTPKAVTVSLNAPSSAYTYNGSTTYASIASGLTGFSPTTLVGSDSIASITSTTLATGVAQAGSFTITPSNAVMGSGLASNYSFTYSPLVVSIAKASLTLAAATDSKTYDGTTASNAAVTITGKAASDTVVASQAFASKNALGAGNSSLQVNTGYTITDASNNDMSANYTVTTVTATGTINKASLTLTAATDSKTYDGTTSSAGVVGVSGNVASDTVAATQVFASKNVLGVGNSLLQVNTGYTIKDDHNVDMSGNYNITTATATGTINKATLSLIATSDSKTYDGTTNSTVGVSVTGKAAPDTVVATQAFADKNVLGTGNSILQIAPGYTIKDASNVDMSGNYLVNVSATAAGTISPATASIAAAKPYDGLVTLTAPQMTISGVNGETLSYTGTALLHSANVRDNASNYVSGLTALADNGSALAANYVRPSQTAASARNSVTISKVNATVTAGSNATTYSGVAQTINGFTATGLVNGETEAVLTGVTANATGTNAGTYTSTASGTDSNYNLSFVTGALTINKANATVTAGSSTTTYTGLSQSVSGFTAAGLVPGESTSVLTGVTTSGGTGTNAGTYASTASGTATNYNLTFVDGALTINKAHLTVTANNASKTYGDTNPALSATVSGFVNGETLGTSGVSGAGAASTTATALTGAGTVTITPSLGTLAASNYDFTNWVNGTLTINKANATVTASSRSVTYTGLAQSASGFTATGLVNGEAPTVLTGVTTSGGTGTNAGNYTHIASGTDSNYNLTFVNGALTIGKANATVIANGGTTTYNGAAQSVSGFTATGLVNGETTAVLSGVTAGATGTNAGTYTSTASGTDSNYNLTFTNGTYTINKAPLNVSLTGQTKVYDGTTSATLANGSLTLTGFMSGEGATVSQTQASYNSANVLNANTVTASLAAGNYTASNGTLLSNYVLPTTASGTGSITPARLSATGTKTYDGLVAFDATGLAVSGVNGETFAATGSGTMGSKNVQTNQALSSIAGLSLSGNNGALTSNYVALATSDTQVSVTPLAVNLSAPAATKTYDSTTLYQVSAADLATLSSQLVGNDRVTAADVVYANKDAGTGKRVSLNSVTISDDNGGNNYTVGKLDVTTGVINKAQLTVSVVSDARFVTQADAAGYAGVVYNGLVGGETASVLTAGSITRSNASVNGAGQYTGVLQASGWQSGNYNVSYNAGDYTIAGAHTLLVSVPTASTTYGTAATYSPTAKYLDSNNNTIVTLTPTMTGNALTVSDGAGGTASFAITAANATLSSSNNVQAGGYNLQASNVVKTGDNFQNLVMTGGMTVTPKVLNSNLGVQPITKVYDGSASISNLGLSFNRPLAGVSTGDTVSLVGSGSFDDRHVAANKTVNLSLGLLGADAANYALATPSFSTNTGSITQLASVTYTGATNGNWADFSNWAGGAMPDRNNVAQVVVPTGKTVVYNSDQVGVIGSTLAVDGAIRFTSSNAFTLANTVSGAGDLQQRGNGMLTVSGTNTNFSGNLDIGTYQATLNNAQALGTAGHVVSSGGQLSVASGVTLSALHVDGAVTVDTAIKTTGDQVYNGALTFLSSGTAQSPNFVSDSGNVDFVGTVSAGSGAMTAQRALAVSAPHGSVLFNDQVGRSVKNLDFSTYLSTGLLDTSPYALTVTAPTIKLYGDVTTFESQTYDGAVRVGSNGQNGHTRLLVSIDPSITFKGTVDDADPTGKVNGLDVRAISLAALTANSPVPTITFESDVGSVSPLANLRLAAGIQNTVSDAMVTDIKTDDPSRRDSNYKGDIVLKGDLTVDAAPEMIAEQLLAPNGSPTLTWYTGTPDFRLRLPALGGSSVLPTNLQLVHWGHTNSNNNTASNTTDNVEAGRQWLMAHDTHEHATQVRANEAAMKTMDTPSGRMVADVQVGNEASTMPTVARGNSSRVEAQTVNVSSSGAFVQVREFAPQTLQAQQAFVYELPADTFVHSREKDTSSSRPR